MLKTGQKLWCVYTWRRDPAREVEIIKVGRKWLTLSNGDRADIKTLRLDGGECSSPGQCYLSKKIYEEEQALLHRWGVFRMIISDTYRCPDNMTIEKIEQAVKILEL